MTKTHEVLDDTPVQGLDNSPRGKLLQGAARLFREKGFDRTTVRDIAREVGIQSGSIFHHFSSKEDILLAVVTEAIRFNTLRLQNAVDGIHDPVARLRALIREELESIVGDTGEAMSVLVIEWRCLGEASRAKALALRAVYEDLWMETLNRLREQGVFADSPFIMRRLITGMTSWSSTWFDTQGDLCLDDLAEIILHRVIGE